MSARLTRFILLALRRLRAHLGLTLLSVLGITLAVGLVGSIPIFTQAVTYQVLHQELAAQQRSSGRPPFSVRFSLASSRQGGIELSTLRQFDTTLVAEVERRVGLPVHQMITSLESYELVMRAAASENAVPTGYGKENMRLGAWTQVEPHIVVDGEPFGALHRDGRIGVWVHDRLAVQMGLQLGETFDIGRTGGQQIPIYVAGFWRARDQDAPYWFDDPSMSLYDILLVPMDLYEAEVVPQLTERAGFVSWFLILDDAGLARVPAETCAEGLESSANYAATLLPGTHMDYSPLQPLERFLVRKAALSALLLGFSIPAMGLLIYFLALISAVTATSQREDSAVFASRGATPGFVLALVGLETLLLIAIGTPLGVLLAGIIAVVMGYSQSFLLFVSRPALPVTLAGYDLRLLLVALLVLIAARLVPAWRATRTNIVAYLRERSRPTRASLVARLALDIPLVATSAYAYQHLQTTGSLAVLGWQPQGTPFSDPLLLLAPSLFVATACLVLAHLFPLLARPLDGLSSRLRSFPVHMGLHHLVRQSGQYTNALFLALTCLSLGAFYSSLALSLDRWLQDRIYYAAGADFSFQQGIPPDYYLLPSDVTGVGTGVAVEGGWLLPASDYEAIPGVISAARVADYTAVATTVKQGKGRYLGIDRLDFPKVSYFRGDFAATSLGDLMNRLAMYPDGVLASRGFMATNRLVEGQVLPLSVQLPSGGSKSLKLRIVGSFDYFPTFYPKQGELFVGNLEYLFEQAGGVLRHQLWLRTEPDANPSALLGRIQSMGVFVESTTDARLMLLRDQEQVERVGLFGVLTIGFLAGSVLSVIGLMVYTYASLQARLQQLSVQRAIGASLRDVLATVAIEYAGVIGYGVVGGIVLGVVASQLFVPFFQLGSDPALTLPPLLVSIDWARVGWIAVVFAGTMVLAQTVMLYQLTRRDVFQVLRMGQRE